MKQNITLSLDKDLIKRSKILAAQNETSVSKMLGDMLKEAVMNADLYEASKRDALQNLKKGFHLGGKITWKREDLYDR